MNSPEKVNFVSDRISFVNKISTLLKATSDDDKPIPGYLYKEISDISHESFGYCESLVEYLTDRLEKNSYHVKLKVLKIMRYTVDNGHANFKAALIKMARGVRAATKYGGPPDPLHGNVPYVMVRTTAQELCEVLFNVEEPSDSRSRETTPSKTQAQTMVGMGSSQRSGKMEGFGSSPNTQQKSLSNSIIDGIMNIAEKLSETEADRQRAVLANLDGSSSQYQPPIIASPDPIKEQLGNSQPITTPVKKAAPKHIPGVAGGGWDDSPEPTSQSNSGDSSNVSERLDSLTVADWSTEEQLVTSAVGDHSQSLLTQSQLSTFHRKCSELNSEKVLEFIIRTLASEEEDILMKSLLLLETYLRSDLVNLEHLASVCETSLMSLYTSRRGPPRSKARKIIRILEKLTSHTSILPLESRGDNSGATDILSSNLHSADFDTINNGLS